MRASESITTILIVDDEIDMRVLVRVAIRLASEGLEVVAEASDGDEAMAVWRALDGPPEPDVIILDNHMPGRSGLEVAREILSERPGQVIVLYTAYLDDATRRAAKEAGITACLSKDQVQELPEFIRGLAAT